MTEMPMAKKTVILLSLGALLLAGVVAAQEALSLSSEFDRARDAMADGDFGRAKELLGRFVDRAGTGPDVDEARVLAVRAAIGLGDYQGALSAGREFLAVAPGSPWERKVRFLMGEAFARARGFEDAARIYREQVDFLSGDAHAGKVAGYYLALAEKAYEGENQPDEFGRPKLVKDFKRALTYFERARSIHVDPADEAKIGNRIAVCRRELGDHAGAVAEWEALLKKWPDSREADDALYFGALSRLARGDTTAARQDLITLRERFGDSEYAPLALIVLGESHGVAKPADDEALDRGLGYFRDFLRLHPSHERAEEIAFRMGRAEFDFGRYDRAVVAMEAFLAAYPDAERSPQAANVLAWCWYQKRDFDRAVRVWKEFLGRWPNHELWTKVQGYIANAALEKGNYPLLLAEKAAEGERDGLLARSEAGYRAFLAEYPVHEQSGQAQFRIAETKALRRDFAGAITEWRITAMKYAESPWAASALFRIGGTYESDLNDLANAIETYEGLVARYPASPEARTARDLLTQFRKKHLEVVTERSRRTDEACVVKVRSRNMEALKFRAYRVSPEEIYRSRLTLEGIERIVVDVVKPEWEALVRTESYEKFRLFEREVVLPLEGPGAWIVTCHDDDLTATTLVVVSDLTIVVKEAPDQTLVFAVNERTGDPAPGVRVLLAAGGKIAAEGETGQTGVYLRSGALSGAVGVFAEADGHVAFTGVTAPGRTSFGYSTKVYLYTDRPLYRPGQDVELKGIFRRVEGGSYVLPEGEKVKLEVRDPRDTVVFSEEVVTNDYGTFSGQLHLSPTASIGTYRILATAKDKATFTGGFAVKAFKKPEFTIMARTPRRTYLPGEEIEVLVGLRYFFGGPVPLTTVRYALARGPFTFDPSAHDEFAWFTKDPEREREQERREAAGVEWQQEGELTTDQDGNASLTFRAAPGDEDARYLVFFEALDLNRQWVRESTSVAVPRQSFFALARTEKKVYRPKEEISVRLTTVDALHFPVAAEGELRVVRRTFADGREAKDVVATQKVSTGEDGKAEPRVKVERPGDYRLEFAARDRAGNLVTGDALVTIAGEAEDLEKQARLVASRQIYREGEYADVLVNSPVVPAFALLTFEGERVLEHRVVRLTERSTTLRLQMKAEHSPNVFLKIAIPKNHELFEAGDEVFVFKYLSVAVTPDRDEAKPGDEASFTVLTTDQRGNPVPAEVSFALVDRSVLALEPDRTPQIKPFFYDQRRTLSVATGSSYTFRYHGATSPTNKDVLADDYRKQGREAFYRTMRYLKNAKELLERGDLESAAIELRKALQVSPGHFEAQGLLEQVDVLVVRRRQEALFRLKERAAKTADKDGFLDEEEAEDMPAEAPGGSGGAFGGRRGSRRPSASGGGGAYRGPGGEAPPSMEPLQDAAERSKDDSNSDRKAAPRSQDARGYFGDIDDVRGRRENLFLADVPAFGRIFSSVPDVPAALRQRFADTAAWQPHVVTAADGRAEVKITLPDNLTTWRAVVRGVTRATLVGEGTADLTARKNLLVRIDAPRFLTQYDRFTATATVHNQTGGPADVVAGLEATDHLEGGGPVVTARLAPGAIRPFDFEFSAVGTGLARLTAAAGAEGASDAARIGLPVVPHGLRTLVGRSGRVGEEAIEVFALPDGVIPGTRSLTIRLSPGLQGSLLESLSYLGEFPYGCLEQTVNRFLPAIATEQALRATGSPNARLKERLGAMVEQGLLALVAFQNPDGSFGWFSGDVRRVSADGKGRPSGGDPTMTALAILAMERAREAGYRVSEPHRAKALAAGKRLVKTAPENADKALLLFALSKGGQADLEDLNQVYRYRDGLDAHSLATLALAMAETGRSYNAVALAQLLVTKAVEKEGLVYFPGSGRHGIRNDVETTAFALRALLRVQPESSRIEGVVRWLLAARKGPAWTSTRDTGAAVLALAEHLLVANVERSDYEVEVWLNDDERPYQKVRVAGGRIEGDLVKTVIVDGARLRTGENRVKLVKRGPGSLFYTLLASYHVEARDIEAAGNLVRVGRRYSEYVSPVAAKTGTKEIEPGFKVVRPEARPKEREEPTIQRAGSGDKFRIRITLDAREALPYVIVEDPLPAGVEVVEGQATGPFDWEERRDDGQVFFLTEVPEGVTEITYLVQAIHPGRYSAMPAFAYPMYEPAIWGRSAEQAISIVPESGVIGRPVTSEGVTPDEVYELARRDFEAGRFERARAALTRILAEFRLLDEYQVECHAMLMRCAFALGDDRGAVEAYERLVELDPRRGPKDGKERKSLATAYQGIGEFERSLSLMKGLTDEYLALELAVAETYREIGNPWLAQEFSMRVLSGYPDSNAAVDAAWATALKYVDLKRPEESKTRAIEGAVDTGLMLPEALGALHSFLAHYPKSPLADEACRMAVTVLSRMELYREAVAEAEKFTRRYRDSAWLDDVTYYLAETWFNEGKDYDRVFATGKKILEGRFRLQPGKREMGPSPYIPRVLYLFGKIHHLRGDLGKAVGFYEKVAGQFEDARDALAFLTATGLELPESATFRPGETPELGIRRKNITHLEVRIYPVDLMLLVAVKKDLAGANDIDLTGIATTQRQEILFERGITYRWEEMEISLSSITEKGVYLVVAKAGPVSESSIVIVSDLDVSLQRVGDKVRVYAVNRETREPVRDVFIKVTDGSAIRAQGFTDARGVFEGEAGSGKTLMVVAEKDGHFALVRR